MTMIHRTAPPAAIEGAASSAVRRGAAAKAMADRAAGAPGTQSAPDAGQAALAGAASVAGDAAAHAPRRADAALDHAADAPSWASRHSTKAFADARSAGDAPAEPAAGTPGALFRGIDGDADGGLSKSEFVAAGPTRRPGAEDASSEAAKTEGGTPGEAHALLGRVFDAADADGSGELDHGEFVALKQELRSNAAEALGKPVDDPSLDAAHMAAAYRKDRFDLVAATKVLGDQYAAPSAPGMPSLPGDPVAPDDPPATTSA